MKTFIFAFMAIFCVVASVYFASLFKDLYEFGEIPSYSKLEMTEIQIEDYVAGQGPHVTKKSKFSIHQTTWIFDPSKPESKGKQIATTYDYSAPITMMLGDGTLMPVWEDKFIGIKQSGKRRFVFPESKLKQKQKLLFLIPRNAFLLMEVEVVKVFI